MGGGKKRKSVSKYNSTKAREKLEQKMQQESKKTLTELLQDEIATIKRHIISCESDIKRFGPNAIFNNKLKNLKEYLIKKESELNGNKQNISG